MRGRLRSYSPSGLAAFYRGVQNASESRRRRADAWALSVAPLVTSILTEGYFGFDHLAHRLAETGCRTRRGGKWSADLARRLCRRLAHLGAVDSPILGQRGYPLQHQEAHRESVDRVRRALRDHADDFALGMAPVLSSLKAHGYRTHAGLADALNARDIPPQRAKRWTQASVRHLCDRLREIAARDGGITSA